MLDVAEPAFDTTLLLWATRRCWVDTQAVVPPQLAIRAVEGRRRIDPEGRLDYRRLEVVGDDRARRTAELFEGLDVYTNPGLDRLVEGDPTDHLPALRHDQDEDPGLACGSGPTSGGGFLDSCACSVSGSPSRLLREMAAENCACFTPPRDGARLLRSLAEGCSVLVAGAILVFALAGSAITMADRGDHDGRYGRSRRRSL